MDEYIEQLLAEIPDLTLHNVVKNILDEPIPEAVKERLLKPLKTQVSRAKYPYGRSLAVGHPTSNGLVCGMLPVMLGWYSPG